MNLVAIGIIGLVCLLVFPRLTLTVAVGIAVHPLAAVALGILLLFTVDW